MTKNVYIHIPFCKSKCNYCSFISFPKLELKEQYLKALQTEIKTLYKGEILKTLYIGGGTPSLLTADEIKNIYDLFNTTSQTEITTELNPENITLEYLKALKDIGINRLSFGCQTFDENILKFIGRKHSPNDVINTIKTAQDVGFENISLDLIYGLPNQDTIIFENDLNKAIKLNIQHISLYGLKIDEGCYFYKNQPQNLPDNDLQANMYENAIKILTKNKFEHYEISNFSKPGYYSKHNLNYWDNSSYYGFGVAAHGYQNKTRYYNTSNLEKYICNPTEHEEINELSQQEILEEEIFLGLRKLKGINYKNINKKFNIDFEKKYEKILTKYLKYGYIIKDKTHYRLSEKAIPVSNFILADFLE